MKDWIYSDVLKGLDTAKHITRGNDSEAQQEIHDAIRDLKQRVLDIRLRNNPWLVDLLLNEIGDDLPEGIDIDTSLKTKIYCYVKFIRRQEDEMKPQEVLDDERYNIMGFIRDWIRENPSRYFNVEDWNLHGYSSSGVQIKIGLKKRPIEKNTKEASEDLLKLLEFLQSFN